MREGRLGYNSSNGRYGILSSDLWLDTGLHCGECLQVLMDGKWMQTRMEMDAAQNWYLVGTPYRGDLEYIRANITNCMGSYCMLKENSYLCRKRNLFR